jgi:hypothetical protein
LVKDVVTMKKINMMNTMSSIGVMLISASSSSRWRLRIFETESLAKKLEGDENTAGAASAPTPLGYFLSFVVGLFQPGMLRWRALETVS